MGERRDIRVKGGLRIRVAVAIAVAVPAAFLVSHSSAYTERNANPMLAHTLAPYDGRITALAGAALSGPEASQSDRQQADLLSKLALRQDALSVIAAATLGVNAEARGDVARARRLFRYAEQLSRSDVRTQLWAIEDAVRQEDVDRALHHYDIALRGTSGLSTMLYPILASASADPAIRTALVKTLKGRPAWGDGFINYAPANGANPISIALLFRELRAQHVAISDVANSDLVNALLAAGHVDDGWQFYTSVRGSMDRRMSRDPDFTVGLKSPSRFDWVPDTSTGISVSIGREGKGGVLDFSAPATVGGAIIGQAQALPPGRYRLEGRSGGMDSTEVPRPYWSLTCADGAELGRVDVPNLPGTGGKFAGQIEVPPGCGLQVLTLTVRPTDAVAGITGRMYSVRLAPVTASNGAGN